MLCRRHLPPFAQKGRSQAPHHVNLSPDKGGRGIRGATCEKGHQDCHYEPRLDKKNVNQCIWRYPITRLRCGHPPSDSLACSAGAHPMPDEASASYRGSLPGPGPFRLLFLALFPCVECTIPDPRTLYLTCIHLVNQRSQREWPIFPQSVFLLAFKCLLYVQTHDFHPGLMRIDRIRHRNSMVQSPRRRP